MEENNEVINSEVVCEQLPVAPSGWTKFKNFLFYEIKVELTPAQQEFENRMNEVLYKDITFKDVVDFFCQEVNFGKKS